MQIVVINQAPIHPPQPKPFHTIDHLECPACNQRRDSIIEPEEFAKLIFQEAAPIWLNEHRPDIAEKTHFDYEYYIRCLNRFFAALPLAKIHIGHIDIYQEERQEFAGASCINHELNTLKQILVRAKLWEQVKGYKPLKLGKSDVGRAMEPADEERLFQVASTNYRWKVAYWASILTATTTAGPKEITHLHLSDVELGERPGAPFGSIHFRDGLKNGFRDRRNPLNNSSRWAIAQILKRYYKHCAELHVVSDPEHYILMGRGRSTPFNPWKAMGSWKKAWRSLREVAGMPKLRMYDLRHHVLTKMMEDPDISEQVIEEMAGHALRSSMKKRYSHIRIKPKSDAAQKLELKLPPRSVGIEETVEHRALAAAGD